MGTRSLEKSENKSFDISQKVLGMELSGGKSSSSDESNNEDKESDNVETVDEIVAYIKRDSLSRVFHTN